ncbi:PLP-dependent aminotransferase family protein [Chryseobacterium zhengzhouense]|uniref:PLP-dependent aminotransferase family protein n=1 Tax=Chryseobacterium zhengzhouense TaxID=1636086 RepID=A0ABW2LT11_9FLAO
MLPFDRIVIIDNNIGIPIYRQIAVCITNAIRNGILKAGAHLPGSRELAKTLGVHRKTVLAAYDELYAQDWIVIIPRKYVAVSANIPTLKPQIWRSSNISQPYENNFDLPFKIIEGDELANLQISVSDIVIDDGYPDVRLSPIDSLLKTYRSLTTRKQAVRNAHLNTAQGTSELRNELADFLSQTRGINISSENIIITHGAQMSIYLVSQLLLNNDTAIIAGRPGYPTANTAFKETGAKIIEVDVDGDGIEVDAIEEICNSQKINAVYVIPHHHYPTTVTLTVERRMKLLELSRDFSFAIIEDDYDYDYHYSSSPYLPLASAGHDGNVIYIGSFSKMLDPSIRIGFMVAPKNLIAQSVALRSAVDIGGDGYMQNALATMIKEGELKRHLKKAKKIYQQRRNHLHSLLTKELNGYISYQLPSGGMAIWVRLFSQYPLSLLELKGITIKTASVEENAFRFGFASMNEKDMEEAVYLLKHEFQRIYGHKK